jgi:hypothetical protein
MRLLKKQQQIATEFLESTVFVEGIAGTGKTTAAVERIKTLINSGVPANQILLIVPQLSNGLVYREALNRGRLKANHHISIGTLGSIAYQMTDLFWALVAEDAGFKNPYDRPHFLSLETVQYYMTRYLEPVIERYDYFNSVSIDRNRLYTQIVDNLNKSAMVGFSHEEIGERLKSAQLVDVEQAFIYEDAQKAASFFRELCRDKNLVDFSLQVFLLKEYLWQQEAPRQYLTKLYPHLIIDNVEENPPVLHDMLQDWLKLCKSALLIYDTEGSYRRFLGADAVTAHALKTNCEHHFTLDNPRTLTDDMLVFQNEMAKSFAYPTTTQNPADASVHHVIRYANQRFVVGMLDWTAENIRRLVHEEDVRASEIVVISAYLPDAMRFSLQAQLDEYGIPHQSNRPSRSLRDENATRNLITFAKLAYPEWGMPVSKYDITFALTNTIVGCDLVRAQLLTDVLYRDNKLLPFSTITDAKFQSRITFEIGNRYEQLRQWLEDNQSTEYLEEFLSRLFGEVLSQPDFGFQTQFDSINVIANLIDSVSEFRQKISEVEKDINIPQTYISMLEKGILANLYVRDWETQKDAVYIAPAYTYLMTNRTVDYQFWLGIGSEGWGQRLYQPLTQPYILSRQWQPGRIWTDEDEQENNRKTLYELVMGLVRRCRKQVYLGFSEFGEQGTEQRGALWVAIQAMLRRISQENNNV